MGLLIMHIFLALRRDVAVSFRQSAQQLWNVRDYFAAVPCRLDSAPVGSPATHYVGHGAMPVGAFKDLRALLQDATQGVRDSLNWQGRQRGDSLDTAEWAFAREAGELVAAYVLTWDGQRRARTPKDVMAFAGLVPTYTDEAP